MQLDVITVSGCFEKNEKGWVIDGWWRNLGKTDSWIQWKEREVTGQGRKL